MSLSVEAIIARGPLQDPPEDALWSNINPYQQAAIIQILGIEKIEQTLAVTGTEARQSLVVAALADHVKQLEDEPLLTDKEHIFALQLLASVETESNLKDAADKTYERIIQALNALPASNPGLKSGLASAYFSKGDFAKAEDLCRESREVLDADTRLGFNSPQCIGSLRQQIQAATNSAKARKDPSKAVEVRRLIEECWKRVNGMNTTKWAAFQPEEEIELTRVENWVTEYLDGI